jgi:MFS family permease
MGEMYRPAVSAAVADLVPPADRPRAYGYLYWVINLGFAVAPTLGGLVAKAGDTWLFVGDGLTMIGYATIVWWKVPETRPARAAGKVVPGKLGGVFADRVLMALLATVFANALVMWQTGVTLPLDMQRKGIDSQSYGLLLGINGALIVLLQPQIARFIRGRDPGRVLAVAALFFGVGFGLNAFVTTPMGLAASIALWTLGEMASFPLQSAIVADLAPAELRGRYQGAYSMAWGLASTLGPTLGSLTTAHVGAPALWLGCAAVLLACAIAQLRLGPHLARRLVRAEMG